MNESTKKLFKAAADIIVKNCGDRKIFFLGSGDDFQNYLRDEYKIEISGYATDMAPKAVNGKMMLDDMINKTNEYYIVVPMIRSSPTLRKRFKQLGYQLNKDYLFVHRSNTVIMPFSPDYRDSYGNFVHAGGCRVVIGKEVQNSYVYVGDNFKSDGDCLIRVFGQGNARVVIGNNCKSNGEVKFFVYTGAELTIGDDMKVSKNATISVMDNNRVHIGKECMISYEVKLFSGDGHAIFDTETGARTNVYEPGTTKGVIEIGDHCWLCIRSIILNKTIIGDSCIVGAGAVVKGTYPDHCAIAGNPAKKVRDHVTWNRNFYAMSMDAMQESEDNQDDNENDDNENDNND